MSEGRHFLLTIILIIAGLSGGSGAVAQESGTNESIPNGPTAQSLLEQADHFRLPNRNNRLRVALTSWRGDERVSESLYLVWTQGNDRSRVEMLDPKVRGQRVLMTDEGMWLFIPSTRRAIRITPMQRLMGEASYGDIGQMVWHEDYTADFSPDGKTGSVNGIPAYHLVLTATKPAAVYTRVDLSVASDDGRPLTAKFYLASGKIFKSATFSPPDLIEGQQVITRIRFVDATDHQRQTQMDISDIVPSDLRDSDFTLSGLTRN